MKSKENISTNLNKTNYLQKMKELQTKFLKKSSNKNYITINDYPKSHVQNTPDFQNINSKVIIFAIEKSIILFIKACTNNISLYKLYTCTLKLKNSVFSNQKWRVKLAPNQIKAKEKINKWYDYTDIQFSRKNNRERLNFTHGNNLFRKSKSKSRFLSNLFNIINKPSKNIRKQIHSEGNNYIKAKSKAIKTMKTIENKKSVIESKESKKWKDLRQMMDSLDKGDPVRKEIDKEFSDKQNSVEAMINNRELCALFSGMMSIINNLLEKNKKYKKLVYINSRLKQSSSNKLIKLGSKSMKPLETDPSFPDLSPIRTPLISKTNTVEGPGINSRKRSKSHFSKYSSSGNLLNENNKINVEKNTKGFQYYSISNSNEIYPQFDNPSKKKSLPTILQIKKNKSLELQKGQINQVIRRNEEMNALKSLRVLPKYQARINTANGFYSTIKENKLGTSIKKKVKGYSEKKLKIDDPKANIIQKKLFFPNKNHVLITPLRNQIVLNQGNQERNINRDINIKTNDTTLCEFDNSKSNDEWTGDTNSSRNKNEKLQMYDCVSASISERKIDQFKVKYFLYGLFIDYNKLCNKKKNEDVSSGSFLDIQRESQSDLMEPLSDIEIEESEYAKMSKLGVPSKKNNLFRMKKYSSSCLELPKNDIDFDPKNTNKSKLTEKKHGFEIQTPAFGNKDIDLK